MRCLSNREVSRPWLDTGAYVAGGRASCHACLRGRLFFLRQCIGRSQSIRPVPPRGVATALRCVRCGWAFQCSIDSAGMPIHSLARRPRAWDGERPVRSHCGRRDTAPDSASIAGQRSTLHSPTPAECIWNRTGEFQQCNREL